MKNYINQILGNNLRCILPSYWWKDILGKMVDVIESAKSSASSASETASRIASAKQDTLISGLNIKKVNDYDILGSGNLILDTWNLEKYTTEEELKEQKHLHDGEIATVVDKTFVEKSFSECYQPTRSEVSTIGYNAKFTKVDGIIINPDFDPNLIPANYAELNIHLYSDGHSKGYYELYPTHLSITYYSDRVFSYIEWKGRVGRSNTLYSSGETHTDVIERLNKMLREGDFRYAEFRVKYQVDANGFSDVYHYSHDDDFPSDAFTMINNICKIQFAETTNADIYLKSQNWDKLAKESRVTELETRIEELLDRVAALEGATPIE